MSANEIGWSGLLQLLYKFKDEGREISKEAAAQLSYIEKSALVSEDAVTCAIYFNRLVIIWINILESKKNSPFGQYHAIHYFKHNEFQHRGSPHAHILLWIENASHDPIGADKQDAIAIINQLNSVSSYEASGNVKLQTHKHTFTCYKK
ncbi:ATP-dependent DNA helicase [Trichonephila clavata]|uniref:ATP-dependent DNA helicase n=1 Tax=Trichonephila clavata TaxID=2740835 RepID=A0A8X6GED8_TRICU|nr:ATP-dependent DNA helicase [Trichonephila clavata]